jgi:Ca2+-binding RTX toxin-like protein
MMPPWETALRRHQQEDIMAIVIAGLRFEGNALSNTYTGGGGNDGFYMTADDWVTDYINGGSGWDKVDYSASQTGVNITLTDGVNKGPSGGTVTAEFNSSFFANGTTHNYTHHQTVAELTSIEDATGSNFNDVLNGNSGSNVLNGGFGDDVINGGAGADWITGGYGKDVLTGGTEGDTFVFNGTVSPAPGVTGFMDTAASLSSADVITDFQQGLDRIDLRGIDAVFGIAGDQAFTFIGTSQFTGHVGELHEVFLGGNTYAVQGDIDGNGSADFSILVQGLAPQAHFNVSDFWL